MNPKNGYPSPGKQNITSNEVMKQMYFEEWKTVQEKKFDYVVIGSTYCALGFITTVAENNPNARILVLERGQYLHPCHVQNLSPVYSNKCRDASETFPSSGCMECATSLVVDRSFGVDGVLSQPQMKWSTGLLRLSKWFMITLVKLKN